MSNESKMYQPRENIITQWQIITKEIYKEIYVDMKHKNYVKLEIIKTI